jgi:hypothetical protein
MNHYGSTTLRGGECKETQSKVVFAFGSVVQSAELFLVGVLAGSAKSEKARPKCHKEGYLKKKFIYVLLSISGTYRT